MLEVEEGIAVRSIVGLISFSVWICVAVKAQSSGASKWAKDTKMDKIPIVPAILGPNTQIIGTTEQHLENDRKKLIKPRFSQIIEL